MALKEAGCQTIFSDLIDSLGDEQLNLALALEYARAGDTFSRSKKSQNSLHSEESGVRSQ